ncbi:MAG: gamma-glutamylcyclotransferase [Proteobacteria bacterium]|nr:gamma-glutamylcyclotransferase [Pseudomonadota bacterium]
MFDYFAYGSNMLRQRLEARVGSVVLIGTARLDGYGHSFSKLGRDGTGKGNILPAPGQVVHGVVYRLTGEQIISLRRFEGGYEQFSLSVILHEQGERTPQKGLNVQVESFRAIRPVQPLRPTREYVAYYERGMREHRLPGEYARLIHNQARLLWGVD